MPRQRSKRLSEGRKITQQTTPQNEDDWSESGSDNESMGSVEKDEDEDELDRLVLGNGAGFMAQLGRKIEDVSEVDEEFGGDSGSGDNEEVDLEGMEDADLFFLDAGPATVGDNALIQRAESEDDQMQGHGVAWEDSDDDRLMVSLARDTRLRKLRVNEAEDMVSGREYTRRLRRQFQRLNPTPEWALAAERPAKRRRRSSASSSSSLSTSDMDIDDENLSALPLARLLQSSGSLTRMPSTTRQPKLRPEVIDIQRTRDIPMSQPSSVNSLSFHPKYPVLLSSGPASTLYLHHISPSSLPTPNPLLNSVHIRTTPIHTSAFLGPSGDRIFFSGRRRYFHTWDLESGTIQKVTRVYGHKKEQRSMERFKLSPCGRYMGLVGTARKGGGIVNILDASTSQWIAAARIEGQGGIADFAWWNNGEGITIAGKGGEVGEWSIQSKSFVALWVDDGAVGTTVLTLGGQGGPSSLGNDRWVVLGSSSGIVNIYDRRPWADQSTSAVKVPPRPEPTKRFMQLTTPTSCLVISPDGQLLVIASRWKRDALRLVHLPSCAVYRNWPTDKTPFGRVSAVAFDAESQMLAVANEGGVIRLWEIRA